MACSVDMTVRPRWLDGGSSEGSLSGNDDSSIGGQSSAYDSSDDEMIPRRLRTDGIFTSLPATAQRLPASVRMPEIQNAIENNRVVCVLGNTGCGKSTVIPYILGSGTESVRILCTQPRRMAAISLCEHLQIKFFGKRNHTSVGYRVRGLRTDVEETRIVYVTAGYLKTMLTHNPGELSTFSHLILDEVHERGIDSDFLSLMVKRLMILPENHGVKLIVMSATLESDLFIDYFQSVNNYTRPATVTLTDSSRRHKALHKIQEVFVEDLPDSDMYPSRNAVLRHFDEQVMPRASQSYGVICGELADPVQNLIVEIILKNSRDGYSTLVFLPGVGEIHSVSDKLEEALRWLGKTFVNEQQRGDEITSRSSDSYFHIFNLHSQMPFEEQKLALKEPAGRARHVVLCTNVAESSLTVPNVDTVIDCGLRKANSYDSFLKIHRLTSVWCSIASCLQRRGRTGRVCDGKYFKLFTRDFWEKRMSSHDTPEVGLMDLSSVFLNAKYISEFWRQPGSGLEVRPSTILQELVTPPSMFRIRAAVEDLHEAGILRHEADEMSELSLLGTLATRLHVEPQIARLIFFGWLSGMVCEGIILAAACGIDNDVIRASTSRSYVGKDDYCKHLFNIMWHRCEYDRGSMSEPIAVRNLLWAWMVHHYGLHETVTGAPSYSKDAYYAKEFDTFKRSVLNHCSQFIGWIEEEIGDEHARYEAELLRELVSDRRGALVANRESVCGIVFKCQSDFDKLKALILVSANTRLLTADAVGSAHFDETHALLFDKLQEQVFFDCSDEEARGWRMEQIACKLTGRRSTEVVALERTSEIARNSSWIVVPGKDYSAMEVSQAPPEDFHLVKDDARLLPNFNCEYYGMIMPIAVRTCMQIFDRRFAVNLEIENGLKVKIKVPQYSNAVKWGRIARRAESTTWLPVSVNAKSPVGWLHRLDRNGGAVNRFWGVAGKIQGTSKHMSDETLPQEARASNVTILPVSHGGRLATAFLLAALPLHHGGLEARARINELGEYEIVQILIEGKRFQLNGSDGLYPLTRNICEAISVMRRVVAKALDLPGTKKIEANSLAVSPDILKRILEIQNGTSEDLSLHRAIEEVIRSSNCETQTSDSLFQNSRCFERSIMLVADSVHSYTELITDPTLWVPPSMVDASLFMVYRKDQIAEIQERMVSVGKNPSTARDAQEAPVVRLSLLGFSVNEIHRYMERRRRFFLANIPLETIMDDDIDEEYLVSATNAWDADTSYEQEPQVDDMMSRPEFWNAPQDDVVDHVYPPVDAIAIKDDVRPQMFAPRDPPPLPLTPPPQSPVLPEEIRFERIAPDFITPERPPRMFHDDLASEGPLSDLWSEILEVSRCPNQPPQERLKILWRRITKISLGNRYH